MKESIKNLIIAGEGYHIEFKKTVDKTFIEEVCAFANSGGGRILLGVADDGTVKGVDTSNSFRSRVQDTINQLQPRLGVEVSVEDDILAVTVPEGIEKPYGCSKGFFMRMGANSQKLTRDEIIEFYKHEGRIRFDELTSKKADFETDFDYRAFNRFLELAGISKSIDQNKLLRNLDCLTDDGKFTNAGVLFFTKDIDFILNNAMVVCVLFKGDKRVDILDKKDFTGNLIENIDDALLFVKKHTNIAIKIETLQHEEVTDYPEVALREAITNAVCHRDYFDKSANVVVEVFESRVIISNPGGLPSGLPPEEFGTKSVTRNPLIASLLHRADYIEKVGTGIERIRQAVDAHGGSTVDFDYDAFYTTTFRAKIKKKPVQVTGQVGSQKSSQKSSQKNSEKILLLLIKTPNLTIEFLSEALKITDRAVKKQIFRLKEQGFLERIGSDKGGHWKVLQEIPQKSSQKGSQKGSQKSSQKSGEKILLLLIENPNLTIELLSESLEITDRAVKKQIFRLKEQGFLERIGSDKGGHWKVLQEISQGSSQS